ncbi:UbiA family prenyltransferase [Acetoanaerobium sticklandii]|uniref:UbiA family prenyltransferase n=1 Tax=Acetoanaerobium sticklandii TaxID=1511 RepID=UPI003A930E49
MEKSNTTISRYFQFTEIRTKITSLFPFLISILYIMSKNQQVKIFETILFFSAMFLFDLETTAINNYIDTKTNGESIPYSRKKGRILIYIMLAISIALGLVLVYYTDWIVLILGSLCFAFGIFYTFGPLPISRTPFGEIISGIFYGFFIPLILLYINFPEGYYLKVLLTNTHILLEANYINLIHLVLLFAIPTLTTAGIMLANNTCDLEKDILQKRHTLPYYIGKKASVSLFKWIYIISYLMIPILVFIGELGLISLVALVGIIPVAKNLKEFENQQVKSETFIVSIKNYVILNLGLVITMMIDNLL